MRRGRLTWVVAGMGAGLLGLVGAAWAQENVDDQYGQPTVTATVTVTVGGQQATTPGETTVAPGGEGDPGASVSPDEEGVAPDAVEEPGGAPGGAGDPGAGVGPTGSQERGGGDPGASSDLPFTGLSLALLALLGIALLAVGLLLRASQRAAAARTR